MGFLSRLSRSQRLVLVASVVAIALALFRLEAPRQGIVTLPFAAADTPATLYRLPDSQGPIVVIAHGFAGSRQMMEAYALTLARAGYQAVAFDFQGHGRNRTPMSGDVTEVDGTTALLVAETERVIAAAKERLPAPDAMALIGHSMATDIVIRAGIPDPAVSALVAISMYSGAVTADQPKNLLVVTGAGEPGLRQVALDALRQIDPQAVEGDRVTAPGLIRKAIVAPGVEHVGVLQSRTGLLETVAWLDETLGVERPEPLEIVQPGPWLLLLLAGIVALACPLSATLPHRAETRVDIPLDRRVFWAAIALPAIATPLILWPLPTAFLPVLVADYLGLHLLVYGALQAALLWRAGLRPTAAALTGGWIGAVALVAYSLGAFGLALDLYGASFMPHGGRLLIIGALTIGAGIFMVGDALLLQRVGVSFWHRLAARLAFFSSLGLAIALDFEGLFFLILVMPVILLFFIVFGLLGRWIALRQGPLAAGLGLGFVLAWSIGVSFPLFAG
ncbi:MAG: alpha/beta hydrolase [Alphaproteobacteria bacterium]|nr:alpha/beta hydrolase [Alphaproteobacteria bacterium]